MKMQIYWMDEWIDRQIDRQRDRQINIYACISFSLLRLNIEQNSKIK